VSCIFCSREELNIIAENELCFAIYDKYPVNLGHVLIIPKRHYKSFFDATIEEVTAIYELYINARRYWIKSISPLDTILV